MQTRNNGESKGVNRLYSEHLLMPSREQAKQLVMTPWMTLIPIVEDCISKVGIRSVQQVLEPIMQDSIRKVNAEIQSAVEKMLIYQNRNSVDETTTLIPKYCKLKFLDTVSDPVYTGREIRGKDGTGIKIALVHSVTEDLVDSGPLSSLTVEIIIYILERCGDEDKYPHFRAPVYVKLDKGIGTLPKNAKLVHNSAWTKRCNCSLVTRVVQNYDGSIIEEASTESFTVLDRRSSLGKKHDQPFLYDKVWRLKKIRKDGPRHKRLLENNISTVQEFLWLYSVDSGRLENIFGEGHPTPWRDTVEHARKCDIHDKTIYVYFSSPECKIGVVFDVVGQLKGLLRNSSFVPIESVAEAEQDDARKLLARAFENQKAAPAPASENEKKASAFHNWKDITIFDEAAFQHNIPCTSNDENATNSTGLDCHFGQYSEIRNSMAYLNDEASFLHNIPCTSNDENATNSIGLDCHFGQYSEIRNNMAYLNDEASFLHNIPCTSNDENATNSTGLDCHFGQYYEIRNSMAYLNDEASFLHNIPCTSNDENAANSTGVDGSWDQYFENAEISNEPPFRFPENVSNSFYDPFPLWNFNDGHDVSI